MESDLLVLAQEEHVRSGSVVVHFSPRSFFLFSSGGAYCDIILDLICLCYSICPPKHLYFAYLDEEECCV